MVQRCYQCALTLSLSLLLWAHPAAAHFGMVIPSDSMVMPEERRTIQVALSFSHPMEMVGMDLIKPAVFKVMANGVHQDLSGSLQPIRVMGRGAWQADVAIARPGVYVFYMVPEPYWEPAEDRFIVHYTKTVVTAFGDDEGWDAAVGLKTEIVPLSRPFGLYSGNVFQGVVMLEGKPVAGAQVEVEYYNQKRRVTAPSDVMVTQTVTADRRGVFTYGVPAPGWWGFAALNTAKETISVGKEEKEIEIGAVIWVQFHPWQEK